MLQFFLLDGDFGKEEFCLDGFWDGDFFSAGKVDGDAGGWEDESKSYSEGVAGDGDGVSVVEGVYFSGGLFSLKDESSVNVDAPC